MNFNDIFYKPKRESKSSIIYNKRRKLAFLTSLALICSLSADVSNINLNKGSSKDKINDLKILSNSLLLCRDLSKLIDEDMSLEKEISDELVLYENNSNLENVQEIVTREIQLVDGPAKFARYIRDLLKDVPNQVKYDYILEHFKHTPEQFDEMQAVICYEAKPKDETGNRYVDAFSAINSVYNRMCSKTKCGYAKVWLNKNPLV